MGDVPTVPTFFPPPLEHHNSRIFARFAPPFHVFQEKGARALPLFTPLSYYIFYFGWNSKNRGQEGHFSGRFAVPTSFQPFREEILVIDRDSELMENLRHTAKDDGASAIAYAILRLNQTVDALRRDLCFGDDGPNRVHGVLERIAIETADLVDAVQDLAPK